jgi:hypothetical protein
MDNSDLFGDIELMDILPLIVMGVVKEALKHSYIPTLSREGVLLENDYVNKLLNYNNPAQILWSIVYKEKDLSRPLSSITKEGVTQRLLQCYN